MGGTMEPYIVVEVEFGSARYQQTLELRDRVMRAPLGLSIKNDDLSYEQQATVLAVFDGDTILGTGILTVENPDTAKVRFLCVDPALQKSGVGRAIMRELEKRAVQLGIKRVYMDSRITAAGFYKKQGYREYGDIFVMKTAPMEHIRMEKIL
jgi:N-acetylglutamate synthase-like GNAT family acetyltransferase